MSIQPIEFNLGAGSIRQARFILDNAAILTSPTHGPYTVVPAPGANKIIVPINFVSISNIVDAYDDMGEGISSTLTVGSGNILNGLFSKSFLYFISGVADLEVSMESVTPGYTDIINQPVTFEITNNSVNLGDGGSSNYFLINIAYQIFNIKTGLFE
tara:strand:- start:510 stop:980 length:471 start_codon:yes stop_codon:yes gene_type:complete